MPTTYGVGFVLPKTILTAGVDFYHCLDPETGEFSDEDIQNRRPGPTRRNDNHLRSG